MKFKDIIIIAAIALAGALGVFFPQATNILGGQTSTNECEEQNGVTVCTYSKAFTAATTTVCAIQSPKFATSTLDKASSFMSVSSTTASVLTFAKSASAFATTTFLHSVSISAGAQDTSALPATTTAAGMNNLTFAPGQWLVYGMSGTPGTFSPTGRCEATFTTVQ